MPRFRRPCSPRPQRSFPVRAHTCGGGAIALLCAYLLAGCSAAAAPKTAPTPSASTTLMSVPTDAPPITMGCRPNQLVGQFIAGGLGTGNQFAEILVRNVSPSACSLQGSVGFSGIDAHGERIAGVRMNQPETLRSVTLPPATPAVPPGVAPASDAYLVMYLMGAYRDDPNAPNGLCSVANEITPSQFVTSIGDVSIHVVNDDRAGISFKSLEGCHGAILGEGAALSP